MSVLLSKRSIFNSLFNCSLKLKSLIKMETCSINRKRLSSDTGESDSKKIALDTERVKRRKVAMLISYSGVGYLGMQRNPERKTIEEDLLQALLKSGYISKEAYDIPQSIQFQRAARTDKGVSAARQVISAKLPEEIDISAVNEHLPDQIRIMCVKRTTRGFNCQSKCNARTYCYILPTFAFSDPEDTPNTSFRISPETMSKVNNILSLYEGTHNFHNFTSRKRYIDPSAKRYMMKVECTEPFVSEDMEFAVIKIKGQSFMLHQIRKMVGLAIAVCRGHTTVDTIEKAWKEDRLDIPMAPSLGLMLDVVHYDHYNQKYGDDGIHDPLDWASVEEKVEKFKEQFILPTIVKTEKEENSMYNWLITLPLHSYDIREDNIQNTEKIEDSSSPSTETAVNGDNIPNSEKIEDSSSQSTETAVESAAVNGKIVSSQE